MYQIYALVDPRDMLVRYVGMSKNVLVRFLAHLTMKETQREKTTWIQGILQEGLLPELHILAKTKTYQDARKLEQEWIQHLLYDMDMPLVNISGIEECTPLITSQRMETLKRNKDLREIALALHTPATQLRSTRYAADAIGTSRQRITQLINSGRLPAIRVGDRLKVRQSAIDQYLSKNRTDGSQQN